jgi:hypothetical protein
VPYLGGAYIRNGPFYVEPWSQWSVYLYPLGSPETVVADESGLKYATHMVGIEVVKVLADPGDEGNVVGRSGATIGVTRAAGDVCAFYENNTLGLTVADGLELGDLPSCEVPENGYTVAEAPDVFLMIVQIIYRARTRPFYRTGA